MQVFYSHIAQKKIAKLLKKEKIKAAKTIRKIALDPRTGKKLKGKLKGLWSARAWPYRIIYRFSKKVLIIVTIEHRQQVYK